MASALSGRNRHDNASKRPNTLCLLAVPAQMDSEASGAVKGMLLMRSTQECNVTRVGSRQARCMAIQTTLANAKLGTELPAPSRVDLFQDG
jgi:hypothetical protein